MLKPESTQIDILNEFHAFLVNSEISRKPSAPFKDFYGKPVQFCEKILGVKLFSYQKAALKALDDPKKNNTAFWSGNGSGKSFLMACIAVYWVSTRPLALCVLTAPTEEQIKKGFFKNIAALKRQAKEKLDFLEVQTTDAFHKQYKAEWIISGRTSNSLENIKGSHAKYMLYLVDEGQGVDDEIFKGIKSTLTTNKEDGAENKLFVCGNPGYIKAGFFYEACKNDRLAELWNRIYVDVRKSPNVDKDFIKDIELTYGKDSPEYSVMVAGEWPDKNLDLFCPAEWYDAAITVNVVAQGKRTLGVDIARGGNNQTVATLMHGGVELSKWKYQGIETSDPVALGNKLLSLIDNNMVDVVCIDDTGSGWGVGGFLDSVCTKREHKFEVIRIVFGSSPEDKLFFNNKSEILWNLHQHLANQSVRLSPDLNLKNQLVKMYYRHDNGKKRIIDSHENGKKKDYKKSPDETHSLALALWPFKALPFSQNNKVVPLCIVRTPEQNPEANRLVANGERINIERKNNTTSAYLRKRSFIYRGFRNVR